MTEVFIVYEDEENQPVGIFSSKDAALKGIERWIGDSYKIKRVYSNRQGFSFDVIWGDGHEGDDMFMYIDTWDLDRLFNESSERRKGG